MLLQQMLRTTPELAMEIALEKGGVYPPVEPLNPDEPSKARVPTEASDNNKLSKKELIDKIKGTIYGNCLGDAIGLATEFMTKKEAKRLYRRPLQFSKFARDHHRSRWMEGDWTDDSDQMILIIDAILHGNGAPSSLDFATRLKYWVDHGFPELGDLCGLGIGFTTHKVVDHKNFLKNEGHDSAKHVWEGSGKTLAANGAVMRTSVLGIVNFHDLSTVERNSINICKVTHADPRCMASCVAITTAIALLLQGSLYDRKKPDTIKAIKEKAIEQAARIVGKAGETELLNHANAKSLEALQLDDDASIGYTYKAMGAALYCLENYDDFEEAISDVTFEAGDADSNGAVAGAVLGAKLGYSKLPSHWLAGLPHKEWLDKKVDRLLRLMGLIE